MVHLQINATINFKNYFFEEWTFSVVEKKSGLKIFDERKEFKGERTTRIYCVQPLLNHMLKSARKSM